MRLGILTDAAHPALTPDDQLLLPALARHQITGIPVVWRNVSDAELSSYDGLLVRSPWDYFQHFAEFARFLERLSDLKIPTWNSPRVLYWNSQKRYLQELMRLGVAVIPTRWMLGGELGRMVPEWDSFVIKPEVSGGGDKTFRSRPGGTIPELPRDLPVMVQPYLAGIEQGELSLVYFGGTFSHAVRKLPALGGFLIHEEHGGRTLRERPEGWVREAADKIIEQVCAFLGEVPVYARVDGVVEGGAFLLMELELLEPALYLGFDEGAADRLSDCVAGLGV